jgi:hypothetical protein
LAKGWLTVSISRAAKRAQARRSLSGECACWAAWQRFADFLLEEPLILVMRTNPKPRYRVTFQQSKRSVSQTNAHRVNWLAFFHSLEEKAWVGWIISPQFVDLPRSLADFWWQSPVMLPE